jgi:hypothetical protein
MRLIKIGDQGDALKEFLSELVDMHPTKLKPSEKHRLRDVYRQILINVIYNSIRRTYTAIPRGKPSFNPGSYWNQNGFTYRFTIAALDRLESDGYIIQHTGFYNAAAGFGRLTRIYGKEKLSDRIGAESIADHLQFQDPDEIKTLVLKGFGYEPDSLPKDHPDVLRLKVINEFLKDYFWAQKTPIRLIYTGGPLLGGRLYSRFQNMPRALRADLTINGLPTVEIDYKANHIRMLIALSGMEPPDDPYLTIAELAGQSRERVKSFINVCISASNPNSAFNACKKHKINKDIFVALETATIAAFPKLKLYLGLGVNLQSLEGQIALNIMVSGAEVGIPVLPVHDSFLTTCANEDWLRDQMVKKWMENVNTECMPKIEKK